MPELLPPIPDMRAELESLLRQVPGGRVTTYGRLADALGNRIAARWVGHYMLHHRHDDECPCHRVVRVDGTLGTYIGESVEEKATLLKIEGVPTGGGKVDLPHYAFENFQCDRPLERIRQFQEELVQRVRLEPLLTGLLTIGGVDVSYLSPTQAVATYTLIDRGSCEVCYSKTIVARVKFPYISTYLSFRELPALVPLLEAVREEKRLADVVLVDGSGILHQRQAGIATHLGVVADLPTIGVTKKLLCGSVHHEQHFSAGSDAAKQVAVHPVVYQGRAIGAAVYPPTETKSPLYVSPGHRVDLQSAVDLVCSTFAGHRLPEPIYWADRISRREAKQK